MTFVKGQSGNPAGRRPGSRNKVTQLVEEMVEGRAETLTKEMLDHACLGNPTALRICFGQLMPQRRGAPVPISLPPVETLADLDKWSIAILNGIASGEMNAAEAVELMKVVESVSRRLKAAETDARVARLEQVVAALLGEDAGIPQGALASATNLQAQTQQDGAAGQGTRQRVGPDRIDERPLASASNQQADGAADRLEPPPESATADDAPLASATNLQADRIADRAAPPPESAAVPGAPLACATYLQAPAPDPQPDRGGANGEIAVAREMLAAFLDEADGAPLAWARKLQALPVSRRADPPPCNQSPDAAGAQTRSAA
jgi:hypothetical protein